MGILHHSRDQLCSLAFVLGNIYFIACSYAGGFGTHSFQKCSKPAHWGVPFLLSTIPFFARFGQSIRRWWDSGSITHLINVRLSLSVYGSDKLSLSHLYIQAGKYFMGIVFYFCYQLWRHNGEYFSISSILSVRLTGFKVDAARASYFSASSEQFIQHIIQHGQVQCCAVVIKADSWVLGCTYGLVSLTPTCALHVPTRRATLLEPYSGAFRLILTRRASLTSPRQFYYLAIVKYSLFPEDEAQLTQVYVDHQRSPSLYLDSLHPDARAKYSSSYMVSSASRSAATQSMERLYVYSRLVYAYSLANQGAL